jgi:hypothetical protein
LAAWAAAAIEIERDSAIESIEDEYFRRADRSLEEIQAVVKAFSMHGSLRGSGLQDRIVASYRSLLQHHPQVAPLVARDLYAWKRRELVEELSTVLREDSAYKTSEMQLIRRYLRAAGSSEELALDDD